MLVSIIIPTRNEEKFIGKCLDSFLAQTGNKKDHEVLCVDGMSTDRTVEIIKEHSTRDNRIKLITNTAKITPVAMNLGVKQAKGDFIMVVSCHAEYAPDYIDKCLEVAQRTGADQVGGYMITRPAENTAVGTAIAAATSCRFGVGNSAFRTGGPEQEVDIVPFGMYRREVFEKIGLYDERLVRNQDLELNKRLLKAGGKTIISPEIKLKYYNRSTYMGLWQQAFNNGLWIPYTIWLSGSGFNLRHLIPMFFVSGLITFAIGAFWVRFLGWILLGYIMLYLSTASVVTIQIARQTKTSAILVLWSFVVLHLAYGLGSIWAIITIPFKFPNPRRGITGQPPAYRKT
ncbi:MAG: glycosyltransferase family 2 protein [Phycisphaerae bacterium]|nr:glycosyltransferase family 2 protein [Phycisphaerae bacterium]MDD5380267.1 glycosyltransferase family 2 protein [Phycisphaerae bacterium]